MNKLLAAAVFLVGTLFCAASDSSEIIARLNSIDITTKVTKSGKEVTVTNKVLNAKIESGQLSWTQVAGARTEDGHFEVRSTYFVNLADLPETSVRSEEATNHYYKVVISTRDGRQKFRAQVTTDASGAYSAHADPNMTESNEFMFGYTFENWMKADEFMQLWGRFISGIDNSKSS